MRIIMTALAPLECRHPRLGQSLSVCVCVCMCVTPKSFKACSNCEVQHSYALLPSVKP